MKRHLGTALALLLGLTLTGPLGAAAADDEPSPSAVPTAKVTPTNQPPVAVEDAAEVVRGSSVTVEVLTNDTDDGIGRPEGTPARLEVVGASGGDGTLTFTSTTVTFSPGPDEPDEVLLSYRVSDGELESTGRVSVRVLQASGSRAVSIYLAQRVVGLRSYRIHGRVRPARPGPVRVRVQRLAPDGRWLRFGHDSADAQGRYSVRFRPNRVGRVIFRAVAQREGQKQIRSGRLTRRVQALADVRVSGPLARGQVRYSWRPGCPVPPRSLREIHLNRFDYGRTLRRGSVVVHAAQVADVVHALRAAFDARFPIRRMRPVDHFYAGGRRTPSQSDVAAMKADNTSAFNCRPVTGNPYRVSQHSYGNAVDINTVRNPYVTGSRVYPSWARRYLDRSRYRTGMILAGGVIAKQMRRRGWLWGARWAHPDYQHFSSNGG